MKIPFENLKKADWIFICFAIIIILVMSLVHFGKNKVLSKTPVLAEKEINFSVFFRGVTITDDVIPFHTGDNTFITIRNVPYTKLEITDVQGERRKTVIENNGNYRVIDDISVPYLYDFEVSLKDKAKITDDGAVVGGNKIKMGIPVILEGKNYKFSGVVSKIQIDEENENNQKLTDQEKD